MRSRAASTRRRRSFISSRCWTAGRRSSPAASASASRWAAPSCATRRCSCSTSRCPISTPSCAARCAPRSRNCTRACTSTVIYVTHDQVEAMTLADRIVIMRDGHIEQVGTPDDVFHRPATRFVAGFIGSPPMNLVEAEIADDQIVFANGDRLPLPPAFPQRRGARSEDRVRPAAGRSLSDRPRPAFRSRRARCHERPLDGQSDRAARQRNACVRAISPGANGCRACSIRGRSPIGSSRSLSASISRRRICSRRRDRRGACARGRLIWRRSNASNCGMVDLPPKVKRTDAIQSFVSQETPIVTITDTDGAVGVGYSYTIGTGGSSVMRLLADHLAPRLIGKDADRIEAIWRELEFATHATTIGAITALALAAIDTALWDLRCKRRACRCGSSPAAPATGGRSIRPRAAGCICRRKRLVEDALAAREKGFRGSKIKIGRPHVVGGSSPGSPRCARRSGDDFEIMTDANQGFALDEAIRRAGAIRRTRSRLDRGAAAGRRYRRPRPAVRIPRPRRSRSASRIYSIRHFREYLAQGRLLDRADRRRAHRRNHALAEGRACGGSLRHARLPAFPDGAACQPRLRRSERPLCRVHSRSSTI